MISATCAGNDSDRNSWSNRARSDAEARREMRGNRRALLLIECTEGVRLDQLPNLVVFAHCAACSPSFKRSKPFLIQLLTVPKGSCKASAISLWLKPSKYAISIAFFC